MKFSSGKCLGDQLKENLAESVQETVKKRSGLATTSSYEIRAIIDDKRVSAVRSLSTAFIVYEMKRCCYTLHNSETWINMKKKTLKELDKIQLRFLHIALGVGTGCTIPMLYATYDWLHSHGGLLRRSSSSCTMWQPSPWKPLHGRLTRRSVTRTPISPVLSLRLSLTLQNLVSRMYSCLLKDNGREKLKGISFLFEA